MAHCSKNVCVQFLFYNISKVNIVTSLCLNELLCSNLTQLKAEYINAMNLIQDRL